MERSGPIVVHIGYHKTGSTWLQRELFPKVRNGRLVSRPVIRRELLVPHPFRFDPQAARRNILEAAGGRAILSEEELSGNLHTAGLHGAMSKEIAQRLARTFPDAHIVVFVRDQMDMVASSYKQYVEGGGTGSIRRFLRPAPSPHKTPNFSLEHLAYDGLIGLYDSLFGSEAVHVYPFEALRRERDAFVARFAADLALDLDPADLSFAPRNVGYRRWTLRIVRVLNHFHDREIPNTSCWIGIPGFQPVVRRLGSALNRLPFMGPSETLEDWLDPASIARIEERFRESNERLEKSRVLGLRAFGYPMPLDPTSEQPPGDALAC